MIFITCPVLTLNFCIAGALRGSHGHVEEAHAQRISQVIGSVGHQVEQICASQLACTFLHKGDHHKNVNETDIPKYVKGNRISDIYINKMKHNI